MANLILDMQDILKKSKYYRGPVDGNITPDFDDAVSNYKAELGGMIRRPFIGPETLKLMGLDAARLKELPAPWVNEMGRYMGMHERADNKTLLRWLKSDGSTLGDPAKLPWCGDAVHTSIRLTLPDEPFSGDLAKNPYWALNWLQFGTPTQPCYGAILAFERPGGGHVGFAVGIDEKARKIRVRGGNQKDMVSDAWLDIAGPSVRLRGYRYPLTFDRAPKLVLPKLDSKNNKSVSELS